MILTGRDPYRQKYSARLVAIRIVVIAAHAHNVSAGFNESVISTWQIPRELLVDICRWKSPLAKCHSIFCGHHGLTISVSKTEVVVFDGSSADTWYLGEHALPRSKSFKYLGLIFDESGSLSPALARLAQNGKGALALLHQKFKKLMCDRSFPMMRRLFDTIVLPTVSYGCEVWVQTAPGP